IVDCRTKLDDEGWGAREYTAAHIPGAVYVDLNRDLSAQKSGTNGRHPLPDAGVLAARLGQLGIQNGMQVVAYDQDNGPFASRFWWSLRWLGHDAVAVLDGGIAKWLAEGRPTATGAQTPTPRVFVAAPRPEMTVDVATVARRMGSADWRLADARAPERFRGEVEPLD